MTESWADAPRGTIRGSSVRGMKARRLPRILFLCLILSLGTQSVVKADVGKTAFGRRGVSVANLTGVSLSRASNGPGFEYRFDTTGTEGDVRLAQRLSRAGFDFVRLVVNPLPLLSEDEQDRSVAVALVGRSVQSFNDAGLSVIVDLHVWPGSKVTSVDSILATPHGVSTYARALGDLTVAFGKKRSGRVALELANEPRCSAKSRVNWALLQRNFVKQLRAISATLPIVVTGCGGQLNGLLELSEKSFFADTNIIYSFHFYEPFAFTHQKLVCPKCSVLDYPSSAKGLLKLNPVTTPEEVRNYVLSGSSRTQLEQRFQLVSKWARSHGIPANRVLLGEFGAAIGAFHGDEGLRDSQLKWLRDVRELAEAQQFMFAFWVVRDGPGGFNYDPGTGFIRHDVLRAVGMIGG